MLKYAVLFGLSATQLIACKARDYNNSLVRDENIDVEVPSELINHAEILPEALESSVNPILSSESVHHVTDESQLDTPPPPPPDGRDNTINKEPLSFVDTRDSYALTKGKISPLKTIDYDFAGKPQKAELKSVLLTAAKQSPIFAGVEANSMQGLAVIDLSSDNDLGWAGWNIAKEFNAASTAKLAIMLGAFWDEKKYKDSSDPILKMRSQIATTFAHELKKTIKNSSNYYAGAMYYLVGQKNIKEALLAHKLYDLKKASGLWDGFPYTTLPGLKDFFADFPDWKKVVAQDFEKSPGGHNIAISLEALMRMSLLIEQGKLIDAEASRRMKGIMKYAATAIGRGGQEISDKNGVWGDDEGARIYNKVGYTGPFMNEIALVESESAANKTANDGKKLWCTVPYRYIFAGTTTHNLPNFEAMKVHYGKVAKNLNSFFRLRAAERAASCVEASVKVYNAELVAAERAKNSQNNDNSPLKKKKKWWQIFG